MPPSWVPLDPPVVFRASKELGETTWFCDMTALSFPEFFNPFPFSEEEPTRSSHSCTTDEGVEFFGYDSLRGGSCRGLTRVFTLVTLGGIDLSWLGTD
ncbi:hypothetical protein LIER_37813 [Lithospermum erythrorhizon]|uniref:Uncharacterized protein n=1 Tax=Lithospermum erythrorhizon TaxID=34254 RepID=A0AAV3PSN0_LITER